MNASEMTKSHLEQRIKLEEFQQKEVEQMTQRHVKERQDGMDRKYFIDKQNEQLQALMQRHKTEQGHLFDIQTKEYEDWKQVKDVIRVSKEISDEQQQKIKSIHLESKSEKPKEEQKEETFLDKLKALYHKMRNKDYEPER